MNKRNHIPIIAGNMFILKLLLTVLSRSGYCISTILIILVLSETLILPVSIQAQCLVTAHASAEIVQAVQATSHTQTNFEIQKDNTTTIELGDIVLNGGRSGTCTIMMIFGDLTGANGSKASCSGNSALINFPIYLNPDGSRTLRLEATAGEEIFTNTDKFYAGGYQIIFAYN